MGEDFFFLWWIIPRLFLIDWDIFDIPLDNFWRSSWECSNLAEVLGSFVCLSAYLFVWEYSKWLLKKIPLVILNSTSIPSCFFRRWSNAVAEKKSQNGSNCLKRGQTAECKRQMQSCWELKLDTDHSFYLLDGQVVNNGRAPLLQRRSIGEERRDGHFGRHPDVAQRGRRVRRRPFGNVEQPLGTVAVLEQVADLFQGNNSSSLGSVTVKKSPTTDTSSPIRTNGIFNSFEILCSNIPLSHYLSQKCPQNVEESEKKPIPPPQKYQRISKESSKSYFLFFLFFFLPELPGHPQEYSTAWQIKKKS